MTWCNALKSNASDYCKVSIRQRIAGCLDRADDWFTDYVPGYEQLNSLYRSLIPYDWRPMQVWYRLCCYIWHRYTTVKPRTLNYHTWCDRAQLMPHAMFEILTRFIEEECSPGIVDWTSSHHIVKVDGEDVNVREEMQALYDWWHQYYLVEYPAADKRLYEIMESHKPTRYMTELPSGRCLWEPKFDNELDKTIWDGCRCDIRDLERNVEGALRDRLHRLVNIIPYLWT